MGTLAICRDGGSALPDDAGGIVISPNPVWGPLEWQKSEMATNRQLELRTAAVTEIGLPASPGSCPGFVPAEAFELV
jgi:hypothetical protein